MDELLTRRTTLLRLGGLLANGGKRSMLSVHTDGSGGYIAAVTMGVVRA